MGIGKSTGQASFGVARQCGNPFVRRVLQHGRCSTARQMHDSAIISATDEAALRVRCQSQASALMTCSAYRFSRRFAGRHDCDAAAWTRLHAWPLWPFGVGHHHMPVAQGKSGRVAVDVPAHRDSGSIHRPRHAHHRQQRRSNSGWRSASSISYRVHDYTSQISSKQWVSSSRNVDSSSCRPIKTNFDSTASSAVQAPPSPLSTVMCTA